MPNTFSLSCSAHHFGDFVCTTLLLHMCVCACMFLCEGRFTCISVHMFVEVRGEIWVSVTGAQTTNYTAMTD